MVSVFFTAKVLVVDFVVQMWDSWSLIQTADRWVADIRGVHVRTYEIKCLFSKVRFTAKGIAQCFLVSDRFIAGRGVVAGCQGIRGKFSLQLVYFTFSRRRAQSGVLALKLVTFFYPRPTYSLLCTNSVPKKVIDVFCCLVTLA